MLLLVAMETPPGLRPLILCRELLEAVREALKEGLPEERTVPSKTLRP